jgi:Cu/Zn superoxide dismutase
MRLKHLNAARVGLTLAMTAALASAAVAETVSYKADLKASNEVPVNTSTGTGSVAATFDTSSKKLNWTVTFSNLTGAATAAHFHGPAAAGKNAGVAVPIAGTASPMAGSATLTDAQAADLKAGKWYVNVHTAANKDGEIRGQVLAGK